MRAYQTEQIVPASHLLTVQLPADFPTGPASVIVLFPEVAPAGQEPAVEPAPAFANLAEFAHWLKTQASTGRSHEEIDRQIEEERNAWE